MLKLLFMANVTLIYCLESIYSHNVIVDGRDISFNIWDSPFSQVMYVSLRTRKEIG